VEAFSAQWLYNLYIIIDSKKDKPIPKGQNQVLREPSGLIKSSLLQISSANHVHIATGLVIFIISDRPIQHHFQKTLTNTIQ
jgi:hypothetical protein